MTLARWTPALVLLLVPACYEGPADVESEPWSSNTDTDTDGAAAVEDEDEDEGGSTGGPQDPAAPGGETGSTGDEPDPGPDDTTGGPDLPDDSGTGGPTEPPPPSDEVPDNAYCQDVTNWDASFTELENEILTIVNARRAEGANCGTEGSFGPAGPLTMNPALRCSSRVHSLDMVERNFFDHTNPSGQSPFERMIQAGYSYSTAGENIAAGNSTAEATMQQWMDSDGHCSNIMNPNYTELGVGYYPGGQYGHVWTQNFGAP